jgi:hypothetical protein
MSSFFLKVAATSISVMMPKPCCFSASVVRATASSKPIGRTVLK